MTRFPILSLPLLLSLLSCAPPPPAPPPAPPRAAAAPDPAPAQSRQQMTEVLDQACGKGNVRSCLLLARRYSQGQGLPRDEARARTYFNKACDHGDVEACARVGRATAYEASVRGGVPAGVKLSQFKSVSVGPVTGPDSELIRAELKEPLEEACQCSVTYGADADFLDPDELLVAGSVVQFAARRDGPPPAAPAAPRPPAGASGEAQLKGLMAGKKDETRPRPLPGRCQGTSLAVKLWLVHPGNRKKLRPLLVAGRGPRGQCRKSMNRAVDRLVESFIALLNRAHTRRVVLFKDPALPALEQGNARARQGNWDQALALYDAALKQATDQQLPAASRGHALYSRGLALHGLGRYKESLATLKKALEVNPEPRYKPEIQRLKLVDGQAWAQPPPVQQRPGKRGKRRKLFWQPSVKRKIVWE